MPFSAPGFKFSGVLHQPPPHRLQPVPVDVSQSIVARIAVLQSPTQSQRNSGRSRASPPTPTPFLYPTPLQSEEYSSLLPLCSTLIHAARKEEVGMPLEGGSPWASDGTVYHVMPWQNLIWYGGDWSLVISGRG
ncbi:hypothetical protein AXG93_1587s1150 [Marchantia polymorpha subsp. ruderalis]|uniref:Uncharacterized protein n=1 Tax=Marchantia polymorpha subsp. ruderalis TaxID=1480154 RepID=A0A176WPX7_MARPO|nr:hypothetical protein AXG93_1587s1150 [Marchantia polymorpha subsp. ruderalis]